MRFVASVASTQIELPAIHLLSSSGATSMARVSGHRNNWSRHLQGHWSQRPSALNQRARAPCACGKGGNAPRKRFRRRRAQTPVLRLKPSSFRPKRMIQPVRGDRGFQSRSLSLPPTNPHTNYSPTHLIVTRPWRHSSVTQPLFHPVLEHNPQPVLEHRLRRSIRALCSSSLPSRAEVPSLSSIIHLKSILHRLASPPSRRSFVRPSVRSFVRPFVRSSVR